jgi:hypothetical protein
MPQAELVEDVGVGSGEFGNRELTKEKLLENGFVGDAAGSLPVRPDRLQSRCGDAWLRR